MIKKQTKNLLAVPCIENVIYNIRGYRVMLDEDLAKIYGVETKVFNQAIRRNNERFPEDFMFQLSVEEFTNLMSQIVISRQGGGNNNPFIKPKGLRSQIVTSNRGGRKYRPYAFTEHGTVMLAKEKSLSPSGAEIFPWSSLYQEVRTYFKEKYGG